MMDGLSSPDKGNLHFFNNFSRLKHEMETSDAVDRARLYSALQNEEIDQGEYVELADALLAKKELIIDGLAHGANNLGDKVEQLGIDPVTKLLKRDSLVEKLEHSLNQLKKIERPLHSVMLVAIDLDNLKKWNSIGHPTGDKALLTVANAVKGAIRDTDFGFRLGDKSDEIIVMLNFNQQLSPKRLQEKFEEIRNAVNSRYIEVEGKKLPVTAATGYVTLEPNESRGVEDILGAVDRSQVADKEAEVKEKRIKEAEERLAS